jgi:hypothetical protein
VIAVIAVIARNAHSITKTKIRPTHKKADTTGMPRPTPNARRNSCQRQVALLLTDCLPITSCRASGAARRAAAAKAMAPPCFGRFTIQHAAATKPWRSRGASPYHLLIINHFSLLTSHFSPLTSQPSALVAASLRSTSPSTGTSSIKTRPSRRKRSSRFKER